MSVSRKKGSIKGLLYVRTIKRYLKKQNFHLTIIPVILVSLISNVFLREENR